MLNSKPIILIIIFLFIGSFAMSSEIDRKAELALVEKTINNHIKWPLPDKNTERLYNTIVKDSTFFIFHPDNASTIVGFDAFKKMVDNVFMNPACRPTGSEIKNLRVNLSRGGDVAWFSCSLNDYGEWDGRPYAWLNTRWTGVLEKQDGKWLIVQMHFSFASDAQDESQKKDSTSAEDKR